MKLIYACVLSLLAATANASWINVTPPLGSTPVSATGVGSLTFNWWTSGGTTGPYADIYYPSSYGGFNDNLIEHASCVVVHYHGGGWIGGDPRYYNDSGNSPMPTLVGSFAGAMNCIVVAMSYPTASLSNGTTGTLLQWTPLNFSTQDPKVQTIYGSIYYTGSVVHTFNEFYNTHFQSWKSRNPALKLYVAGESAGAYLAQRLATDGRWPIDTSLVAGLSIINPASAAGSTATSVLADSPTTCASRLGTDQCNALKSLYGEYGGGYNANDLKNYTSRNSTLVTYYFANICDGVSDVGSSILGYINTLPSANRKISVHKSFYPSAGTSGHGGWGTLYSDWGNYNTSQFLAFEASSYAGSDNGKYGPNCTITTPPLQQNIIN